MHRKFMKLFIYTIILVICTLERFAFVHCAANKLSEPVVTQHRSDQHTVRAPAAQT